MATMTTFSVEPFWPHLEQERSHVILTQRRNFIKALRDLKDSVEKNNKDRAQENKKDPDGVKQSKREIAEKLRIVEYFITPQAPHVVKRGLSDLRAYLGRRLTIDVVDQKS